jgi:hypothetical protein
LILTNIYRTQCFLVTLLTLAAPANACLNDRDTLAEEIKGLPEVTQIITGRFERNPPLYYEMRIKRLQSEIPAHPDVLNNYDDIAVALDRVHRDDEAIRWEERKRAKLIALKVSATDPATKENWYRYYANCGTCWVHRWLGRGADRKRIAEVKTARNMIAKAIAIKPGAHEGREKYQLLVMDWLIQPRLVGTKSGKTRNFAYIASGPERPLQLASSDDLRSIAASSSDDTEVLNVASTWIDNGLVEEPVACVQRAAKLRAMWSGSGDYAARDMGFENYDTVAARAYAMRWFRNGADANATNDLAKGVELINMRDSEVRDLNTSLYGTAENWTPIRVSDILAEVRTQHTVSLTDYLDDHEQYPRDAIQGLSGLVVLGAGWQSIDLFDALAVALYKSRPINKKHRIVASRIAHLADLRSQELRSAGVKSLWNDEWAESAGQNYRQTTQDADDAAFHTLRKEADQWDARRTAYMMTRLSAGRHPDSDPSFWNQWHDPGPPEIPSDVFLKVYHGLGRPGGSEVNFVMLLVVGFGIGALVLLRVVRAVRRSRSINGQTGRDL